jgi:hypothetical protein
MNCCGSVPNDDFYDEYTRFSVSSEGSHVSTSDASEVLSTDYRKVTPLFRNIERENWEGILNFLKNGKWSISMLSSSSAHLRCPAPEIQVKTWVTRYDRAGNAEWSQLPLHAAISYLAPFVVIQQLVKMYPKAVQCTDNEGMLPIHLAFGFGAPDNVVALLLERFPASLNEKGLGGRYPFECCELGPNKIRGRVFRAIADQVAKRTHHQMELEWREFAAEAKRNIALEDDQDLSSISLTNFIYDLLKDKKELERLKEKGRLADQATSRQHGTLATEAPINNRRGNGWGRIKSPRGHSRKPVTPKTLSPGKRYNV